jgi:hypothetical protein
VLRSLALVKIGTCPLPLRFSQSASVVCTRSTGVRVLEYRTGRSVEARDDQVPVRCWRRHYSRSSSPDFHPRPNAPISTRNQHKSAPTAGYPKIKQRFEFHLIFLTKGANILICELSNEHIRSVTEWW